MDTISIDSLIVHLPNGLGPSAFNILPPPPCPAEITLHIQLEPHIVPSCVDHDDIGGLGVNYSSVSKAVYALITDPSRTYGNAEELVREIGKLPLRMAAEAVSGVKVEVELPRAVLMARSVVHSAVFDNGAEGGKGMEWTCEIRDIRVSAIVGLHPHERGEMQRLEVDVEVGGYEEGMLSHREFTNDIVSVRRIVVDIHLLTKRSTSKRARPERSKRSPIISQDISFRLPHS